MSEAFDRYRELAESTAKELGGTTTIDFNPALVMKHVLSDISDSESTVEILKVIYYEINLYFSRYMKITDQGQRGVYFKTTEVPGDDPELTIVQRKDPLVSLEIHSSMNLHDTMLRTTRSIGWLALDLAGYLDLYGHMPEDQYDLHLLKNLKSLCDFVYSYWER